MTPLTCTKCGITKPDEDFPRSKIHPGRRFRYPSCKQCHRARGKQHYQANRPRTLQKMKADRAADPEKFRVRGRRDYVENKPARRAKKKEYAKANPARMRGYTAEWRARHLDHARSLGRKADRKRAPKKKITSKVWRLANPARHKANALRWRKLNPDRVKAFYTAKSNRRRAQKQNTRTESDQPHYKRFVLQIKTANSAKCYWCGRSVPKGKRQIDHIIALAAGGADVVSNLCCACARCNCSKQAKRPEEFSGQYLLI